MAHLIYYKVTDKTSDVWKRINDFLNYEDELIKSQDEAITDRLPKFTKYIRATGFCRIPIYEAFVFDDRKNLDQKVWTTKQEGQYMLSRPNRRSKAGKEMEKFLRDFKRTTSWDVNRILGADTEQHTLYGSFYPLNVFRKDDVMYITGDSRYRECIENNQGTVEITEGEINKL